MRIPTKDIPQADNLSDVLRTVDAVAAGASSDREMGEAIGKGPRNGRYYRRAAEILGFIDSAGPNNSVLTGRGRSYVEACEARKKEMALGAVLGAPIFQRVIPYLESRSPRGCTLDEFKAFLRGGYGKDSLDDDPAASEQYYWVAQILGAGESQNGTICLGSFA
jgi:hypothetical protein